jgi:hypothetical protein
MLVLVGQLVECGTFLVDYKFKKVEFNLIFMRKFTAQLIIGTHSRQVLSQALKKV